MQWKMPPIAKIYEALGAIADGRVKVDGNKAEVTSSKHDKVYLITYDRVLNGIASNDNASYWQGYLGYPAIAVLLDIGVVEVGPEVIDLFKEIPWKDLNTQFKGDYDKTMDLVLDQIKEKHGQDTVDKVKDEVEAVLAKIENLNLAKLKPAAPPPR